MIKKAYDRYRDLQVQLETDSEYIELEKRRRDAEPAFLSALEALNREHRQAVIAYLGILEEKNLRERELGCFLE